MGTTLEILAPYLPHGIRCQFLLSDGSLMQRKLVGLDDEDKIVWLSNADCRTFEEVTPVLRGFHRLATPLPDGTIPAVEAINLEVRIGNKVKSAKFIHHEKLGPIILAYADPDKQYEYMLCPNVLTDGMLALKVADYLRKHHFAVGLTPDQYIEKED